MVRNVRWSLIEAAVLCSVLAGCGIRFFAEREPWGHDAEVACLNSGAVGEGAEKVRIQAISGPGACGADFPIKVSGLGYGRALGFFDEPRPPYAIPNGAPPRWPLAQPSQPSQPYDI